LLYGVVLAGGKGERFWPLSRANRPKQFLRLTSNKTMIEETIDRVLPLIPTEQIRIITGRSMTKMVLEAVPSLSDRNIISEPFGRNTAAAIGLAAVHLSKDDPRAVLAVLSADHLIQPADRLLKILEESAAIASKNHHLITLGIVPTRPEIGYGYIKVGKRYDYTGDEQVYHVSTFTEKPRLAVAKEYYFSGNFLWNSGMFVWSAKAILEAVEKCQPELSALLTEYAEHVGRADEIEARMRLYQKATSISIDFAVLEKADNVLTVKADILWDDIGGWSALGRYKDKDSDHNVLIGKTTMLDSYEMTVYNEDDAIIACLGVSDLIVVRSGDIVLVAHKTRSADIKQLLVQLGQDEATRGYL